MIKIGKIADFIVKDFDDYRKNRITLKELVTNLCSYADTNIMYQHLWNIFEEELNKQFDDDGNVRH